MAAQGVCFLFEAMPRVVWQTRCCSVLVLLPVSCQEALVKQKKIWASREAGVPRPSFLRNDAQQKMAPSPYD